MYAYGCYSLKGYEMEALYSFDYVLSDTDVALQEVVDPLINVYNAYKLGKLPLYPAREKFRKVMVYLYDQRHAPRCHAVCKGAWTRSICSVLSS